MLQSTLGQALMSAGDTEEALAVFRRALNLSPRNIPLTMRYAEALMKADQAKTAHAVLLDLFNNVAPTPEQIRFTALAASSAGDTGDAAYYMSEYHIATGNLPLSVAQLEMALAAPKITAVQRSRYQARLDEVREALFSDRKRRKNQEQQKPPERAIPASWRRFGWYNFAMKFLLTLLSCLMVGGCAALPSGKPDPRDPWERFNRATFKFNDALDRAIARPVAKAYVKVMPRVIRTGVSNALSNLDTVPTIINDALQGKFRQAGRDSARFLLNSTLGLGGLFDPASAAGLEYNDEDLRPDPGQVGREVRALPRAAHARTLHGSRRVLARGRHLHGAGLTTSKTTARVTSFARSTCSICAPACSSSTHSWNAATTVMRSYATPGCSAASTRSRTATSKTSRSSSKRNSRTIRPRSPSLRTPPQPARLKPDDRGEQ